MNQKDKNWSMMTKKNTVNLAYWTGAWLLTMALAAFGPKFIWNSQPAISVFAIIINTAVGVGVILANKKHLNGLDEMQRKIHMDAMAIALGVTIIGGLSYSMLDISNVINSDAEISHLVILTSVTYLISVVIGNMRYK
jgi:hypothetical protein